MAGPGCVCVGGEPTERGGGGGSSGDNFGGEDFMRGKFRHTSNFGAGYQTWETSTLPTLGSLWTISSAKFLWGKGPSAGGTGLGVG